MKNRKILVFFLAAAVFACGKEPAGTVTPEPEEAPLSVSATQKKAYVSAAKDLEGMDARAAGLEVQLFDSKYFAVGERVLSVSFETSGGQVADGSGKVTMEWVSEDPVNRPAVGHGKEAAAGFGITVLPGEFSGTFTVKTSRYTYTFPGSFKAEAGKTVNAALDFASPQKQPVRKVGVMGDSISTFDGAMCDPDYSPFYPGSDPNVSAGAAGAVDSKEKTYWWKLIYNYMKNGSLDVNSSWSGTRVVHEVKTGRKTGKSIGAGFVDRAYDFVDPDIILVHGGTNDKNQSSPLGNYDYDLPLSQLDETCFRSAYIKLIKMLQTRYEGVQLILIIGDTLTSGYETSIIEIAKHYGLPYIDFVGVSVPKCKGSHPTEPGFEIMAQKIYDSCKDYLP